jgi:hypothetical protein
MTSIEITEDMAKYWIEFEKNYDNIKKMLDLGVFEKDNISVVLYFDKFSSIRAVDKTKRLCVNYKTVVKVALQN